MYAAGIECVQQLHKVVNVHGAGSPLLEPAAREDLVHEGLDVEVWGEGQALQRAVHLVVLLHQQLAACLIEGSAQRLILSVGGCGLYIICALRCTLDTVVNCYGNY